MKTEKKVIYLVTGNASKFKLFSRIIPPDASIELRQVAYDLTEEQTEDQEQIAVAKAKQAWNLLEKPLIVDDFGVYFHKFNNFPGAFTKFVYKGLGFENLPRLFDDGDEASFLCIAVYIFGPNQYKVFSKRILGTLKKSQNLNHDTLAPFEAIFIPQGFDKTYEELEQFPELYNKIYFRVTIINEIIKFVEFQNEVTGLNVKSAADADSITSI